MIQPLGFGYLPLFSGLIFLPFLWCLRNWIGQNVRSGVSVISYGKTRVKLLANLVLRKFLKEKRKLKAADGTLLTPLLHSLKCRKSDLNSNTEQPVNVLEFQTHTLFPLISPVSLPWVSPLGNSYLQISVYLHSDESWELRHITRSIWENGKSCLPPWSYLGMRNICYHPFSNRVFDAFIFPVLLWIFSAQQNIFCKEVIENKVW